MTQYNLVIRIKNMEKTEPKLIDNIQLELVKSEHSKTSIHKLPRTNKSRLSKIKDRNSVYPPSCSDKIVFITNKYGNGFKRESLADFNIPYFVPIEQMHQQINNTCYQVWNQYHSKNSKDQFQIIKLFLKVIVVLLLLIMLSYLILVSRYAQDGFNICNYFIYSVFSCLMIVAVFIALKQQEQINYDQIMIEAIKDKLAELNSQQISSLGSYSKYRWTCHTDCLWIAINLG